MTHLVQRLRARLCYWIGVSYHYWGNAHGARRAYAQATRWYQRALELRPSLVRPRLNLGILYWRELGEPHEAVRELSLLLERGAAREAALFNRAVAYQQLGDEARARLDFRTFLEIGEHPYHRAYAEKMLTMLETRAEEG
ncbi:MAG: tetratricopeptide repeat protein [Anaerolineae bacterium]